MKTVGQLKREQGLKSEPQVDSMYKVNTDPIVPSTFTPTCFKSDRID